MTEDVLIDLAVDFIENFDKKNVDIIFLFTSIRAGSMLFQSLLDSHPQILTIPFIIPYYSRISNLKAEQHINFSEKKEDLISFFLNSAEISDYFIESFCKNGLGENKDKKFNFKRDLIFQSLSKILNKLKLINRKTFFLAYNLSFAIVHNIDFTKIKCIFSHEHIFRPLYDIKQYPINLYYDLFRNYILYNTNECIKYIKEDFSDSKLIYMVRDPIEVNYRFIPDKITEKLNFHYFMKNYLNSFILYVDIHGNHSFANKIIKFEDLHINTEKIMKEVSEFLKIDFSEILLKSTLGGELWWGNDNLIPKNGTNKNLIIYKWKDKIEELKDNLFISALEKISKKFDYIFPDEIKDLSVDNFLNVSEKELINYIKSLFYNLNYSEINNKKNFLFCELYMFFRKVIFFYSLDTTKFLEVFSKPFIDNSFYYKNNLLTIQFKWNKEIIYSDNGHLIFLQKLNKKEDLDNDTVKNINLNADEIWLTTLEDKEIYIKNNIDPDKIFIIEFDKYIDNENELINIINKRIEIIVNKPIFRQNFTSILDELKKDFYISFDAKDFLKSFELIKKILIYETNDDFYLKKALIEFELALYNDFLDSIYTYLEDYEPTKIILELIYLSFDKLGDNENRDFYYDMFLNFK